MVWSLEAWEDDIWRRREGRGGCAVGGGRWAVGDDEAEVGKIKISTFTFAHFRLAAFFVPKVCVVNEKKCNQ